MKLFLGLLLILSAVALIHSSKGVPGGTREADINDPDIQELSQFTMGQLEGSTGSKKTLVKLVSAKTQVVSGKLITLVYQTDDNEGQCFVKILEKPWLNQRDIIKSTCGHNITKTKRSVGKTHVLTRTRQDTYKKEKNVMDQFEEFIQKHGKQYKNKEEYKKRYHVFKSNLKKIQIIQENEQGTAKYGVTRFADMTEKEFKRHLGLKEPAEKPKLPVATIPNIQLPEEYDWRNYNAVTPVKNQGACGSCWAFSVTGNIEGQWAIKKGELISLSEQEIVDCDTSDSGCNGGYMSTAYDSIVRLGGLETEKDYPYEAEDEKCHLDQSEIEVRIQGGLNISSNEDEMAKWLVQNGPISVALNANVMQFYFGGVSHPYKFMCNPNELDHGVLIVGYGVHTSKVLKRTVPYWIVKNSWGKGWGELGYYRIYRGDGTCGINQMATSAVV